MNTTQSLQQQHDDLKAAYEQSGYGRTQLDDASAMLAYDRFLGEHPEFRPSRRGWECYSCGRTIPARHACTACGTRQSDQW